MFEWIDPFEEIEREKRRTANAREEGRQEVIRFIENEQQAKFAEALDQASRFLASSVAENFLRPHLVRHRMEYDEYQRRLRLEEEANYFVLQPPTFFVSNSGKVTVAVREDAQTGERLATLSVHTTQPFQYSVAMSLSPRRDGF